MPYKDIMVYIDDGVSNPERMKSALNLAKSNGARLTGVTLSCLKPDYLKVKDPKAIKNISLQEAEKRIEEFSQQAQEAGVEYGGRIIQGDPDEAAKRMAQVGRNFDLLILRQANPQRPNHAIMQEVAEQVILLSGRPCFFMPYIGAHRIPFTRAMIAWDGTPAATRSVHNALPILKHLEKVFILIAVAGNEKTTKGQLLADDLCDHLKRHGANAEVRRVTTGTFDVPTVILNQIAENDIDLLVMGGYGTPSLKQKLFGGVTRTILSSMIIPVIMSH